MGNGRTAAILAVLTGAFIVYGSLYPFRFHPLPAGVDLVAALRAAAVWQPGGRGDLLVNTVLYMPLGLFVALALAGRLPVPWVLALVGAGGAALSFTLEAAQLMVVGRTTSLSDLVLNTAGTFVGAATGLVVGARLLRGVAGRSGGPADGFAALLVLAWLGYRLYPYVPTLDAHHAWNALKPLVLAPVLEPARALRLGLLWLIAALLVEEAEPQRRLAPLLVPAVLLGTLAMQVLVVDNRLSLADLCGVAVALPAWALLRRVRGARLLAALLGVALAAVILDERLGPLEAGGAARPFGWVPFRSAFGGSWEVELQAMLQKLFLYGALLRLAVRAGAALPVAVGGTTLLVVATSIAQTRIPGRSAEITDAVLVLGAALVFRLLRTGRRPEGIG